MAYPAKKERNKRLVKLRQQNPGKWTWGELAKEFNIARPTAVKIFNRATHEETVDKVLTK